MVTTLTGLLMMLFGSAALISAGLSWQTAASRAGVAGQARAAAERGFHAVIDRLNDPANGHRLVTKWPGRDWVSVSNSDLAACQITRNPLGAVARSAILSDTQTVGGRQVRYTLINFKPPEYPSVAPASLPAVCRASFGNLQGGTAGFTIRGEVLQGGAVLALYELQRYTTVNSFLDTTPGNPPVSGPLAFLATGGGDSTAISVEKDSSILTRIARDGSSTPWKWDSLDEKLAITCLGNTEAQCRDGSSSLESQFPVDGYSLADFVSVYPPSPPYSSQMNAVSPLDVNNSTGCYPYTTCGGTTLRSNCRAVSLPTQAGENQGVIACKIGEINLDGGDLRVDTSGRSVVFYLMNDTPIDIKNGQIINSFFAANRATDPTSWSRLRLFGNPSSSFGFPLTASTTVDDCSNGDKQTWKIEAGSARINGAFIWAPKGEIEFKEPSDIALTEYSMFGAVWACKTKFEKNVRFLTNGSFDQIGIGIDQVFGLGVQFRSVAQGVDLNRSQ